MHTTRMFSSGAAAVLLAFASAAPTRTTAGCHFNSERVVGCFPDDAQLAVAYYQRFNGDEEALEEPAVKEVLASQLCRVIHSSPDRPFHIFRRGHGQIATLKGYEPISIVEFKTSSGGNIFSIDSKWITGTCDEAPAGRVSE
jgi:hypothetical protein